MTFKPICFFNIPATKKKFTRDLNPTHIRLLACVTEKVATVKTHSSSKLVKLWTDTSKQTNIPLLGSSQSPSPMAVDLPCFVFFLCRDCVMCVLQNWGDGRTWQLSRDAGRYWHRVTSNTSAEVLWHFFDCYCHSFSPRPALLPLLLVMMVGVFLAH